MTTTTAVPDSEPIADLRRRVEELEARVAALSRAASPAAGEKRGWRGQVGAFADDPVYAEVVRLGRAWREAQVPPEGQDDQDQG